MHLTKSLTWSLPTPEALLGTIPPQHFEYIVQVLRHERFDRFQSMRSLAEAVRSVVGDDPLFITCAYEGVAAAEMGDFSHAFECLQAAVQGAPRAAPHHHNCAILILRAQADPAVAATCFERAVACDPSHVEAWEGLAVVTLQTGAWDRCAAAANQAVATSEGRSVIGALCRAAAQERLGRPTENTFAAFDAPPAISPLRIDADQPTILTLALDDDGVDEALRLASSIGEVAADWRLHVLACNPSPSALAVLNAAAEQPTVSWSAEHLIGSTQDDLRALAAWTAMARLKELSATPGGDLIFTPPSSILRDSPGTLLPSLDEGVAVRVVDGLLWDQIDSQAIAVRRGPAAHAFLNEALTAMSGPWRSTPLALGVGLWRAFTRHGARRLTDDDLNILVEGPPIQREVVGAGDMNEVLQSRFGPMVLNRHDLYVTAGVRETGSWSADELDLLSQLIKPGQTVLDVGANMGSHTLAFCNFVGPQGRVYAFEPQRVMFQSMVASVAMNSWANAWCHMAAVGAEPGFIEVPEVSYDQPSNFGIMSLVSGWEGADNLPVAQRSDTVPVLTIDGLNLSACDLIKIDVEGMEKDVLTGASDTLRTLRPILYMECHRAPGGEPPSLTLLKSFGYRAWWHGHSGSQNVVAFPSERAPATLGLEEA